MNKYAAIIIDIKDSRKMHNKDRIFAQDKLYDIIQFINAIYADVLIKKVEFSAGDSIQGLFKDLRNAFNAYLFIRNLFYPFHLRCGIGYASIRGFIDKKYNEFTTNMIDGRAYHLANEAILECKESENAFLVYSEYAKDDILVNQIMHTVDLLLNEQTKNQADICNFFNLIYPINYHNLTIDTTKYCMYLIDTLSKNHYTYNFSTNNEDLNLYIELMKEIYHNTRKNQYDQQNMNYEAHTFYEDMFPTKLDVLLADFLQTSRQNISKIKQKSHADEIRKLELCVMSYFENIYDKGRN